MDILTCNKQGRQSVIVDRIGYDKEGHTVYTKLGNGMETTYTYDKQRERLQVMNLTADGQTVMENRYQYDAVDNILGITNAANPTSLTKLNKAKLGGRSSHTYEYDELNRLIHANGNPTLVTNDSTNTTREMYWDEDNRLMVLSDNGKTSRYTYNAAGERIMKSYGTMGALRSIDYNKYFVIGLVHNEGRHITDGLYPNHYVQLLGFNRQNYASFWTWGEKNSQISCFRIDAWYPSNLYD